MVKNCAVSLGADSDIKMFRQVIFNAKISNFFHLSVNEI